MSWSNSNKFYSSDNIPKYNIKLNRISEKNAHGRWVIGLTSHLFRDIITP